MLPSTPLTAPSAPHLSSPKSSERPTDTLAPPAEKPATGPRDTRSLTQSMDVTRASTTLATLLRYTRAASPCTAFIAAKRPAATVLRWRTAKAASPVTACVARLTTCFTRATKLPTPCLRMYVTRAEAWDASPQAASPAEDSGLAAAAGGGAGPGSILRRGPPLAAWRSGAIGRRHGPEFWPSRLKREARKPKGNV